MFYIKNEGFVEKRVGEELVIVPLVGSVAQMQEVFSLNEVSQFLFELLQQPIEKKALLQHVLNEFEVSEAQALVDIEEFLCKTLKIGIVKEVQFGKIY